MKNNSNIYDIDGELVRRFDDVHRFTALEATKIHEKYLKKIQDLRSKESLTDDENKRLVVYSTYCKNLQYYIQVQLAGMTKEELEEYYKAVLPQKPQETTKEQIEKAIEELKNDTKTTEDTTTEVPEQPSPNDNEDDTDGIFGDDVPVRRESCDVHEERRHTKEDFLVERDNVETVMDEYVQFEELPDSDESSNPSTEVD